MRRVLFLIVAIPIVCFSQTADGRAPLKVFDFFVGSWSGAGKGQSGESQLQRDYEFLFGGKFIRVTHKSTYPPQDKNPKGEVHDEVSYLSYDNRAKQYVLRQFHTEGFVVQYRAGQVADPVDLIVFESESIENISPGWRARETYKKVSQDEFIERFELAAPGKEFELYTENSFKRKSSK